MNVQICYFLCIDSEDLSDILGRECRRMYIRLENDFLKNLCMSRRCLISDDVCTERSISLGRER